MPTNANTPRKIVLDCDPGHDDAIALMLAAANPAVDLLAITTVGGNQTIEKVTWNARALATLIGLRKIPVAAGCARPLVRTLKTASDVHGVTGLDGATLPEPTVPLDERHAIDLIIEAVMAEAPNTVTLVGTGPLTNIALAVRKEPRLAARVREVVLMGGGYHTGNCSPVAEFNIRTDPEAAHIVFNEPWPITMIGLDLTHQALATADVEQRIRALGTPISGIVVGLLDFYKQASREVDGLGELPVHDPCTIAYLVDPSIIVTRKAPVDVELCGDLTVGMTVADLRPNAPRHGHVQVATKLNVTAFWNLIVEAIDDLGRAVI